MIVMDVVIHSIVILIGDEYVTIVIDADQIDSIIGIVNGSCFKVTTLCSEAKTFTRKIFYFSWVKDDGLFVSRNEMIAIIIALDTIFNCNWMQINWIEESKEWIRFIQSYLDDQAEEDAVFISQVCIFI